MHIIVSLCAWSWFQSFPWRAVLTSRPASSSRFFCHVLYFLFSFSTFLTFFRSFTQRHSRPPSCPFSNSSCFLLTITLHSLPFLLIVPSPSSSFLLSSLLVASLPSSLCPSISSKCVSHIAPHSSVVLLFPLFHCFPRSFSSVTPSVPFLPRFVASLITTAKENGISVSFVCRFVC